MSRSVLSCRTSPCIRPTVSCDEVLYCVNRQLTRIANNQSTELVNFCNATAVCINDELLSYSISQPTLLTNFPSAITTYLKTLPGYTDTGNIFLAALNDTLEWEEGGSGSGSVTSVGLSSITNFATATGSPITSSGTLGYALQTQPANFIFSGPTTGVDAIPTFRALVATDIPSLSYLTSANNGLSTSGSIAQLGQTVGAIGNPAALISNREIPTGGKTVNFIDGNSNCLILVDQTIATGVAALDLEGGYGGIIHLKSTNTVDRIFPAIEWYYNGIFKATIGLDKSGSSGGTTNHLFFDTPVNANGVLSYNFEFGGNGSAVFYATGSSFFGLFGNKNVKIGDGAAPTATLHLTSGAATAGKAPLKFTNGTNLTTPEPGAMEWDATRLYITQTTGPTRQTIAYLSDIVASTNIYNTNGTLTSDRTLSGNGNDLFFNIDGGGTFLAGDINNGPLVAVYDGTNTVQISGNITLSFSGNVLEFSGLTNASTQDRIIGQIASSGAAGYITVGTGLSLSSGVLSSTASSAFWTLIGTSTLTGTTTIAFNGNDVLFTGNGGNTVLDYANSGKTTQLGNAKAKIQLNELTQIVLIDGQIQTTVTSPTIQFSDYNTGHTGTTAAFTSFDSSGNILRIAAGTSSQYLRGDGVLATTPTGTVTSVTGTTNRITSTGGATPVIDISSSYVGQSSITTLGTITTGTLSTGAIIAGVTMTLGSDASNDIYYRNGSGILTRLANGTTGQVLTATTASAPSWTTLSGGIIVGTTTITSGTTTRILYDNAGVLGEYVISGTGNVAMTTSPVFTTPVLGTPTSGTLTNTTGYLWNNIANPTGTQTLVFDDGELIDWTLGSNTETFWTKTANSLTTGIVDSITTNSLTTGTLVNLVSTSTTLASGNELLNLAMSGVNGTNAITATGVRISVTNTNVTSGTNVGLDVTASGATTNNYAIQATGDNLLISNLTKIKAASGVSALQVEYSGGTTIYYNLQVDGSGNIIGNSQGANYIQRVSGGNVYTLATNAFTIVSGVGLALGAGTTTVSPLKLTTGTNLTTATAGSFEYATPRLFFTNGGAQRQEIPQIQQTRVSTQYDNTTTTLGNITGLTATLVAGKIYRFEATLHTTSNVAGGIKVAIAGTATATAIIYEALVTDTGATTQGRTTTIGTAVAGVTAVTAAYVRIVGLITVNAAGTLTVQAAQNANVGTTSVLVGSTFVTTEMA